MKKIFLFFVFIISLNIFSENIEQYSYVFEKYNVIKSYKKLKYIDLKNAKKMMNFFINKNYKVFEAKLNLILYDAKENITENILKRLKQLENQYPNRAEIYEAEYIFYNYLKKDRNLDEKLILNCLKYNTKNLKVLKRYLYSFYILDKAFKETREKVVDYIIDNYIKVLNSSDKDFLYRQKMIFLMLNKKFDLAVELYDKIYDKIYIDRINYADSLIAMKKEKEAISFLEKEAVDKEEYQIYYYLGLYYYKKNKLKKALKNFIKSNDKKFLYNYDRTKNMFIKDLYYIGKIYERLGQNKKAIKYYDGFKRMYVGYPSLFKNDKETTKMYNELNEINMLDFIRKFRDE